MAIPSSTSQLSSLTGLRWMAALSVFGYHVHVVGYFAPGVAADALRLLFGAGMTGVSFFFVLSGFVLAWSARPADQARAFWRRRFARIYPVHLVTAILALLLAWALLPGMRPTAPQFVANLLLIHSWNPDLAYSQSLNPVSWSLACEAFFYAAFPLLFGGLRRLDPRHLSAVAALCTAAVVAVPFFASPHVAYFLPLARLPEFVLGITLAGLVRAGAWRGPGVTASLGVLGVGYALATVVPPPQRYAACTIVGFAVLIAAVARDDTAGRPYWLGRAAMVKLGELSFAFYMIHILVIRAGEALFTAHPRLDALPALGAAATAFTVSLALSWWIYEAVEAPARRLLLHRRPTARPRPAPVRPRPPADGDAERLPAASVSRTSMP